MSTIAAVILAAGVSSRMGRFKPLLEIDGSSMIRRVIRCMQETGADPIVVVTGYRAGELQRHLAGSPVQFVHNPRYYETQMLDSLLLGLEALPQSTRRVLIAPADVPLIKPETIHAMLEAEGAFIRPTHGGRHGHPVLMDRQLLPMLRNYRGEGGLRGAIAACGIIPTDISVDDLGVVLDSDTKDEYTRLLKYRRQDTQRPQPLQLDLQVYLQAETSFWDAHCAQFMELIQTTGSMTQACRCMHMSYSKGWTMLNEVERQLGYPVLVRSQGGINGGGSALTEQGARFLAAWQGMYAELQSRSLEIFQRYFPEGTPSSRPSAGPLVPEEETI